MNNIIVIADTHFGSSVAVAENHQLDDGGIYLPAPIQIKLLNLWQDFWDWAYNLVDGEFTLVHVGDVVDGDHHHSTQVSSSNLQVQESLAKRMLRPHALNENCKNYFQIRGTGVHVGDAGETEERIAEALHANKINSATYSRWELWLKSDDDLIHFAHHIGNTSSSAYESSAMRREMVAAYEDAGVWGRKPPTILVRAHTHRFIRVEDPRMIGIKMPAWQSKTAYVYKIDRLRGPMFGGIVIRTKPGERASVSERIYTLKQTESVQI